MSPDQGSRAEGVGIAYHPFLHDALLTGSAPFDFVELPLDLYLDPARAALLDPADARLDDIIGATRCHWRGTALSLGSVGPDTDPAPDPRLIRRINRLLEKTAATQYTETIGFRRFAADDVGTPQHMPRTEAAARWIAARQLAASEALGVPILLQLPPAPVAAPPGAWDEAAFLHRIAALAGCEFDIDTSDLARIVLATLPAAHIAVASIGCDDADEWAKLSLIAERVDLQSIVLRRHQNLPLDTIGSDVARAAEILRRSGGRHRKASRPAHVPPACEPEELVALRGYQSELIHYLLAPTPDPVPIALAHVAAAERDAFAARACHWRNWHVQVSDIHKARQLAAFLSPRTGPSGPYRAVGRG